MVALLWVFLSFHCRIEALPGVEFLRCASVEPTTEQGSDPCQESNCCSAESAKFHAPRQHEISPVAYVAITPTVHVDVVVHSLPKEVSLGILTAAPPDLKACWQFFSRTALSPRAPSFVS